ncbi:hypothetical protein L5515_004805 [Caenorhabditis briggsae]|uniref:Transposase Tc5 C-terminal domain-containing protein n=1 Tax=Caenorhabditis briggsae TaxID=6238 RepID=A0AAE9JBJ8_CAEBR|nr:hypothetical protein L3Y34_001971 [Caenorhabditis briggsae]UMM24699.1 hypothetical protein L5515_004805 [Caenorhabditis briggsae]
MSKFRRILTYILDLGVNPKRQPLDEEDLKLAAYLIDLGESIDKGDFDIEMEQHLSNFEDDLQDLNSWNSWKDTAAIDSVTPSSHKLKLLTIPAGCTGRIQPCAVGIFGSFKKVVKTLTNYAQLTNSNYKFQTRDETLKLLSLVWRQLCSPKLEKWARYAWVAAGYDVPRPASFETPAQLLFPRGVAGDCTMHGCSSTSFVKCLYCEKLFCFEHFVIDHHNC